MTCFQNMEISCSCRDEWLLGMFRRPQAEVRDYAHELLQFVGLYSKRDLAAGSLSFGQQKLLEFAMALLNEPSMLLLHDPTPGINPTLIHALIDRLRRPHADLGLTLLVSAHYMRVIMNLARHIYCLAHGAMLAEGDRKRSRLNS